MFVLFLFAHLKCKMLKDIVHTHNALNVVVMLLFL